MYSMIHGMTSRLLLEHYPRWENLRWERPAVFSGCIGLWSVVWARVNFQMLCRLHRIQGRCGKFPVLIFGWMNVFVIRRPRPNRVVRLSVGYDLIMSFELTKSIHTPALDLLAAAEYWGYRELHFKFVLEAHCITAKFGFSCCRSNES